MKTKQEVKLLFTSPLWLIANAIRYSHSNHDKSDSAIIIKNPDKCSCPRCNGKVEIFDGYVECIECDYGAEAINHIGHKDLELIKRVGFKYKHESVLEFGQIVFHVAMSQKALLEESRHRIGLSQTVTSSRYALRKIDIQMEPTHDEEIDKDLEVIKQIIEKHLKDKKSLDKVSKLLPQAFIYTMQLQFNLRSLLHFLRLRLSPDAHIDIRSVAYMMFKELPIEYKELVLCDEQIAKQVAQCEELFEKKKN